MAPTQDKPAKKPTTKKTAANEKAPAKQTAAAKQTAKPRASRRRAPTHEAIAKRAHELSQAQGGGDEVSHWLQAERELTSS
jgi:Protein of unknown function (DUF2934)